MIRAAILLVAAATVFVGCGSSSKPTQSPARAAQEEDRRDSEAIQRQVDQEVDERVRIAATEAETASGRREGSFVKSETLCTKQSATAYKCLTTFTSPPGTQNVVTDVTCDRNGERCITESK